MTNWKSQENTLTIVTPPDLYLPKKGAKIFLAGSIDMGDARDWQKEAISFIQQVWVEDDVTIYNPRRDGNFVSDMQIEQSTWEIFFLNSCDYIVMHLIGSGPSPNALLELGLHIRSPKLYLSIEDNYPRKELVEIYNSYYGKYRAIHERVEESLAAIKLHWFNH